ncbi:DNA polymerase III subunit beta [Virgibacillus oceani]|uniref:Beta sliding clamp n=1 Tax=Virgibacillus oceani TaxID=1479511 RepID=A0A917HQS1_9BACI|nr:DNA polymerase III subunit beta [Virgibacillus oceani]GGG86763.1 DNA polymerase III subunit beta [Virgibacillus oceani]
MEFNVNTTAFKNAVFSVSRIIQAKTAQSELASLKISADTEGIIIEAVNSVLTMKRFLPCMDNEGQIIHVIRSGSILISPAYFVELLKKLPGKIHMKVNENFQLKIESENISTTLSGMDPSAFPNQPFLEQATMIQIHTDTLRKVIEQTLFAVSHHDANPALTGVNWVFDKKKWYSIATNSQRLVLTRQSHAGKEINGSYTIPAKALAECLHCFKNDDKEITITFSNRFILFQGGDIQLYSKLITSSFPNVGKLIPAETNTEIIVETAEFLKGIDRMILLASSKKNHNVAMKVGGKKTITLKSDAGEIGEIKESQAVIQVAGDTDFHIIFDGEYMKQSLQAIEDTSIKLILSGPYRPIRIEPLEGDSYLHLISPLRG